MDRTISYQTWSIGLIVGSSTDDLNKRLEALRDLQYRVETEIGAIEYFRDRRNRVPAVAVTLSEPATPLHTAIK